MAALISPADMVRLEGGQFMMGSVDFYPEEAPRCRVEVKPFLLDVAPVTNAHYAAFVEETGYITLAETVPDPADYPGILPDMIKAGSIVFESPTQGPPIGPESWWAYRAGACWRHPYGPDAGVAHRQVKQHSAGHDGHQSKLHVQANALFLQPAHHARGGVQRVMHMRGPVKVHPRQPDANIVQHVAVEFEMAWERAEGVSDG